MYIYLKGDKVFLTMPVIGGEVIATDNTCKTFKRLEKFNEDIEKELTFFDSFFGLLGEKYSEQRKQIQQYQELFTSLRQQGAFNGIQSDDFNTDVLKEFLDQSNVMVLDPQTNRDNYLKSSNPTFSLKHKKVGETEVHQSILGVKLRAEIANIEIITLDTPSKAKFIECLPDIEIDNNDPVAECKKAWLQAGFNEDQWTSAKGALEERFEQLKEYKEEEDTIFDKVQLCGALDSIWAIITENQVSFNSLANNIFIGSERQNQVKIDKIAVLTQFFLGNLNIYLKDNDPNIRNIGIIFDNNADLSLALAKEVQESLTNGTATDDVIINFLNKNKLCPDLTEEQKMKIKKMFIVRYQSILNSDHFDEFFVLPQNTRSPWFYHGGGFLS